MMLGQIAPRMTIAAAITDNGLCIETDRNGANVFLHPQTLLLSVSQNAVDTLHDKKTQTKQGTM